MSPLVTGGSEALSTVSLPNINGWCSGGCSLHPRADVPVLAPPSVGVTASGQLTHYQIDQICNGSSAPFQWTMQQGQDQERCCAISLPRRTLGMSIRLFMAVGSHLAGTANRHDSCSF